MVFERQHEALAMLIITHASARPAIRRMFAQALAAERILAQRILKRQAAAGAKRLGDEMHLLPAGKAQRAVIRDQRIAHQTLRWKEQVEESTGHGR